MKTVLAVLMLAVLAFLAVGMQQQKINALTIRLAGLDGEWREGDRGAREAWSTAAEIIRDSQHRIADLEAEHAAYAARLDEVARLAKDAKRLARPGNFGE